MDFLHPEKTAKEGAGRLREFVRKAGLPLTLKEAGIGTERFEEIADRMTDNGTHTCGAFYPMSRQDILDLLKLMK